MAFANEESTTETQQNTRFGGHEKFLFILSQINMLIRLLN